MKGIYKYTDLKTGEIVYIGKDSHIDKNRRHKQHLSPYLYDAQRFNRILQNNPDRYEYAVIWATEDCSTLKLNKMEILFGKIYDPKFNFDKFGKGGATKVSEETKRKMSEAHKDKTFSEEDKIKMSKATNTSGYYCVSKIKDKKLKQGFRWRYCYYEDSKRKSITSVDIKKLEKKVKAKGLMWVKY